MEPTKRAHVINAILQCMGANRVKFCHMSPSVVLEVIGWGFFVVTYKGDVYERFTCEDGNFRVTQTDRSKWLAGVAAGMVRNDAGELVSRDATAV
jgi:hypothetical protein